MSRDDWTRFTLRLPQHVYSWLSSRADFSANSINSIIVCDLLKEMDRSKLSGCAAVPSETATVRLDDETVQSLADAIAIAIKGGRS